jgi:hypothetical protein
MRYRLLILLGIIPFLAIGQNPLKKELKGNGTSMHYSPSQFSFTNQNGITVYIAELKDRRSLNWNKQVNDSVKIEAVGDYWNYPMNVLFKNKLSQDLTKANINVDYSAQGDNIYKVEPTLDVLYPNFVSFPEKGYWMLSKINIQVSKGSQVLFTKSYQEYTFFNKNINGYNESYNTNLKEGSNVAMWSSIKRLLDQFYTDLNNAFGGQTIKSSDIAVTSIGASNIANDISLNNQVTNYSGNKTTKDAVSTNNYRLDGEVPPLPPPSDGKLNNAVNVLGSESKINNTVKTPTSMPVIDSAKLAERRLREELRKKAIDSAKRAREELALTSKKIEQEEKDKLQFKRDSILKVKKETIALKVREKFISDSIKKTEVNKKIEEAKRKREEEKAKMNPAPSEVSSSEKINASKPKNAEPAVEKKRPQTIARKSYKRAENETVSEAVRRIAREIEEEEEDGYQRTKQTSDVESTEEKITPSKRSEDLARVKAEREKLASEMKMKKAVRDSLLANEKQKKQDSLLAIRRAKAAEIEASMARVKASKDSFNRILAAKKYAEDSAQLVREKERRREAVLAAQKSAMEAERNALIKNPNSGEMFATVSTDPPSKLADNRTREQVLADRIFTPKSENTKNLLARVKLITPEEEARLLAQMKTEDKAVTDSFFIQMQKNRPIPTYTPIDSTTKTVTKKQEVITKTPTKEDKKSQIIEKGLKGAKDLKNTKESIPTEKKKDKALDSLAKSANTKPATKEKPLNSKSAQKETPAKTEPAKVNNQVIDSMTSEQKAKDLEDEIEKKKKEINERLKKAKSW